MATITQLAPFSDTIDYDETGDYVSQINVLDPGGIPAQPVVFVTLVHSKALTVAANGAVYSTGTLANGTYTVSGTISDAIGNSGAFAFTLTVVGVPSALVSLVQAVPTLPSGAEIKVPFQIDPATGGIAYLTDYAAIMEQHIATIVMTSYGERVMLPRYGSPLQEAVFSPISRHNDGVLAKDIKDAIGMWEQGVVVHKVTISSSAQSPTELDILISFSVVPYADVNTVRVTTGGTISQVTSP